MKKIFSTLILFSCLLVIMPGCEKSKFLDTEQLSSISEDAVWKDPALARALLLDIYTGLPSTLNRDGYNGILMDVFSDDGVNAYSNLDFVPALNQYNFTAVNLPYYISGGWYNNYGNIRKASDFIAKVDRLPDPVAAKTMKAEARFLRAIFYFDLWRYYGGVAIIAKAQSFDENAPVVRSTSEETLKYFIDELAAAAIDLPAAPWAGDDKGRIDQSGALGFEAKAFLHAGKWAEAAVAAKAVIDLAKYDLYPSYPDLFYDKSNNEYIVYKDHNSSAQSGLSISHRNAILRAGGWQATQPTQDLVDSYEMTDGKTIAKSPLYNEQNPYVNRDPRLAATILYQGSKFKDFTINFVLSESGNDNTSRAYGREATSYLLKKFVDENIVNYNLPSINHSASMAEPLLRFADILLMYAEAQNETAGPDASVYAAIDRVRARVSMPALPAGLSKNDMRTRIRNERRIELAFEESRFWDIRRWKIATAVYAKPIPGIKVTRNPAGSATEFSYERFNIIDRARNFQEKNYLFPISQYEIDISSTLLQNPGY